MIKRRNASKMAVADTDKGTAEAMALKASERIRNEEPNCVVQPADIDLCRQISGFESEE